MRAPWLCGARLPTAGTGQSGGTGERASSLDAQDYYLLRLASQAKSVCGGCVCLRSGLSIQWLRVRVPSASLFTTYPLGCDWLGFKRTGYTIQCALRLHGGIMTRTAIFLVTRSDQAVFCEGDAEEIVDRAVSLARRIEGLSGEHPPGEPLLGSYIREFALGLDAIQAVRKRADQSAS